MRFARDVLAVLVGLAIARLVRAEIEYQARRRAFSYFNTFGLK